jgi:hypothetical protein
MSWISVRDRLPEENQHVFVWIENPYTDDDGNKIFVLKKMPMNFYMRGSIA